MWAVTLLPANNLTDWDTVSTVAKVTSRERTRHTLPDGGHIPPNSFFFVFRFHSQFTGDNTDEEGIPQQSRAATCNTQTGGGCTTPKPWFLQQISCMEKKMARKTVY